MTVPIDRSLPLPESEYFRQADLSAASDQEVVAMARQGREEAYGEVVHRYKRPVLALIYGIVSHPERAKDLAQDTFVKVFTTLDRYRPERKFAPWILRIAHNTALHYLERKRFDSPNSPYAVTPGAIDRAAIQAPNPSDTPTPRPDMRQLAATLEQALRRLRPEYRRCVKLRYVEGRSYDEIAHIIKVPVGTVGTYLHRARKELKRVLGPLPDAAPSDPAHTPA